MACLQILIGACDSPSLNCVNDDGGVMGGFCERMVCVVTFFLCTLCDSSKHLVFSVHCTRYRYSNVGMMLDDVAVFMLELFLSVYCWIVWMIGLC